MDLPPVEEQPDDLVIVAQIPVLVHVGVIGLQRIALVIIDDDFLEDVLAVDLVLDLDGQSLDGVLEDVVLVDRDLERPAPDRRRKRQHRIGSLGPKERNFINIGIYRMSAAKKKAAEAVV